LKVVSLLSGGLDSTVLLYYLLDRGYDVEALSIYYGQRHAKELQYAERTAQRLGIKHHILEIPTDILKSSALTGDKELPQGYDPFDNIQTATIVPNRNAIMLSLAVGYALSRDIKAVGIAVHKDDWAIYPDCRPTFIGALNLALMLGNNLDFPPILSPFIYMTRAEIVQLGAELDVPFDQTWTCYAGGDEPCGQCAACLERKMAFEQAGIEDPYFRR